MNASHAATDAAVAQAATPGAARHDRSGIVLLTTILASSLAFIDGSVVNVGLPAIGRSLSANAAELQWLVTAYLLPLSALLLLGGAAGDRFGRRLVLVVGTAIFALASVACALAGTVEELICARVCQGVGAALLMPNSLAILGGAFSGEARGRAIGVWASAGAAAGAIGPVLGGYFIDHLGWRAIFFINVPIALAAIGLALAFVRDGDAAGRTPLDGAGAVLATLGLALLTWGLIQGGAAGWSGWAAIMTSAGVLSLVAFVGVEARRGERAMMPLALFGSRSFSGLTLLTLLLYGALGAFLVLLPYVLIETAGYSAAEAGAALLPFPLLIAATARSMGGLAGKIGARIPLVVGPLVAAAGYLLLLRVGAHGAYWRDVFPAISVVALGMAGAVAPLTTAVLASVDAKHTGAASGFNSAIARTGGLVATALLGSVLDARGAQLIVSFHLAAGACALAALLSGLAAGLMIEGRPAPGPH